ncbi:heme NO-binding domain-containing protein [Undibacterium arcticum]|uniref:Heme NO-binding domain-containing protein n=1 Tax=Undibacterium arcticum TaxID=1762892 RepID=A0ABV7F2Q4_9BURK
MLGMVFTEFMEMVEDRFSPAIADSVIESAKLPHGGAYTAVGYYAHEEIIALVVGLSKQTGIPVPDLVTAFGQHLLKRFSEIYPQMFASHTSLFSFVASIDAEIHREVRKLYPQAQLPRFTVLEIEERVMRLAYESPRSMEALAVGLMLGAAEHFGEQVKISHTAGTVEGRPATVFHIDKNT